MPPVRLVLVRHGEAVGSLRGVIAGPTGCGGLTERGATQARALAARLRATGELDDCCALLSSPLPRARQTAAILQEALPPAAVGQDAGLRELDPGQADGLTAEQHGARFGAFDMLSSPFRPFAPDGESWAAFGARVRAALDRLAARFPRPTVGAVPHSGFIVVSVLLLLDIPRPDTRSPFGPDPTALTEWRAA